MTKKGQYTWESILAADRQYLWHPYSSTTIQSPLFPVHSAHGTRIRLLDGRELIDGMASWWSVVHGYNHPYLNAAIHDQLADMSHVMFGGLTHVPAVELAKRLVEKAPNGLAKVFFCDSGSVAVEVAMKMAMQYQVSRKQLKKCRFLTIRGGYHGDTFHAMSVCDPVTGMHQLYSGVLPNYFFANRPECTFEQLWYQNDICSFKDLLRMHHDEIAAVILEPIVQGAGGMRFYHPEYLRQVRELCDESDVLLIADEIATGFGRSGKMFACEHANISPDILCLGKALTGGYMTMAAVLATENVALTISQGEPGVFMHGPTFMANPLACSVALASLDLLEATNWQENVLRIEKRLKIALKPCESMAQVNTMRVLGAIGVVELKVPVNMMTIQPRFVERGVWIRPFGKLVYVMPPYCITDTEIDQLAAALCEVVEQEGKS